MAEDTIEHCGVECAGSSFHIENSDAQGLVTTTSEFAEAGSFVDMFERRAKTPVSECVVELTFYEEQVSDEKIESVQALLVAAGKKFGLPTVQYYRIDNSLFLLMSRRCDEKMSLMHFLARETSEAGQASLEVLLRPNLSPDVSAFVYSQTGHWAPAQ